MKMKTPRHLPFYVLLALLAPVAAQAETLTVEGDLEVAGGLKVQEGNHIALGDTETADAPISISSLSSQTIGAMSSANLSKAQIKMTHSNAAQSLALDPNQIVSDVSGPLHIWNINSNGSIDFRTGGIDSPLLNLGKNGNVGIGTNSPTAKLDVAGDVKISGNLLLNGTEFNQSDYLKKGYTSPRSGFLGNDIYSADTDNALFLSDRRFVVSQTGFTNPVIAELFDGEFDSGNTYNRLYPGESATVIIDLIGKSEFSSTGITYVQGAIYVTSYYTKVAGGLSGRYWDRNDNVYNMTNAEDVYGNGRLWKISLSGAHPYVTKLELTIDGPSSGYAAVEEIEYQLFRPKNGVRRPYLSKYVSENLYKDLSFRDGNNATTIKLQPATGKITATDIELSSTIVLGGASATPTPGAVRYTGSDFKGYKNATDGWVSFTSGGSASSLVVPGSTDAKLSVDPTGKVLLTEVQGDISMGVFTAN